MNPNWDEVGPTHPEKIESREESVPVNSRPESHPNLVMTVCRVAVKDRKRNRSKAELAEAHRAWKIGGLRAVRERYRNVLSKNLRASVDSPVDELCRLGRDRMMRTSLTGAVSKSIAVVSGVTCRERKPSPPTFLFLRIVQPRFDACGIKIKSQRPVERELFDRNHREIGKRAVKQSPDATEGPVNPRFRVIHQCMLDCVEKSPGALNFFLRRRSISFTMRRRTAGIERLTGFVCCFFRWEYVYVTSHR